MGIFGGSSSSASTLNSAIAFNPIINVGDDNEAEASAKQKGTARADSTAKDEFGISAGLALGPASSAQGGEIVGLGDAQPMEQMPVGDGNFFDDGSMFDPIYIVGGLVVGLIGFLAYKKLKKKKKKK